MFWGSCPRLEGLGGEVLVQEWQELRLCAPSRQRAGAGPSVTQRFPFHDMRLRKESSSWCLYELNNNNAMFSDHVRIKLEIGNRRTSGKSLGVWELNNHHLK